MAEWCDVADGARPAQLVPPQIAQRSLTAKMSHREWRDRHHVAALAHRRPDRVVVIEAIRERRKAADRIEGRALERDGRAEARLRQPARKPEHDARQEMRIDEECAELRPWAIRCNSMIEAGDGADARLLQGRGHTPEIVGSNPDIAISKND